MKDDSAKPFSLFADALNNNNKYLNSFLMSIWKLLGHAPAHLNKTGQVYIKQK